LQDEIFPLIFVSNYIDWHELYLGILALIIDRIHLDFSRRSIPYTLEVWWKQILSLRKTFRRIKERLSIYALIMELRCTGDMDRSLLAYSIITHQNQLERIKLKNLRIVKWL
jgi:hypothetical protein